DGAKDPVLPHERDIGGGSVGEDQSEHSLHVRTLTHRQHNVELLRRTGLLLNGTLPAHPVDLDRPPAERPPENGLRDLYREDPARWQRLGDGREQSVGDADAIWRWRDRVAQGL